MKNFIAILLLAASTVSLALLNTGCTQATAATLSSPVGQEVTIQFRRDALGAASPNPIGPVTGLVKQVSITGTFVRLSEGWIVISKEDNRELWIDRSTV